MTNYKLDVTMSQHTVETLTGQYTMFGMQSTATSAKNANSKAPAWLLNTKYGKKTTVQWSIDYGMYTSQHQVLNTGQVIDTNNSYTNKVDLKDLLYVDNDSGTGNIQKGKGTPNSLEVYNSTTTQLSCGVLLNNQPAGAEPVFVPTCLFDLHGHGSVIMQPIEKVLFFFATAKYDQGAVIESAETDALLIDFTEDQNRTVTYDIDAGWSGYDTDTDKLVPAFQNITDVLIVSSSNYVKEAERHSKLLARV